LETPAVALCATCFQHLTYEESDTPEWIRDEGMQENYPFFRQTYLKKVGRKEWGNCCVHCQAMQEDNDDWRYGFRHPFATSSVREAMELRIIYFNLNFDYYLRGVHAHDSLLYEVIH
jgi:hypothetical protein